MQPPNSLPEREGTYIQYGIRERDLFSGEHLNTVAELLGNPDKQVDGICFVIGSGLEYGKFYKVYVPFSHDTGPLFSIEEVHRTVQATIVEMMDQLKGQMTMH